jgi:hypothetical protein
MKTDPSQLSYITPAAFAELDEVARQRRAAERLETYIDEKVRYWCSLQKMGHGWRIVPDIGVIKFKKFLATAIECYVKASVGSEWDVSK